MGAGKSCDPTVVQVSTTKQQAADIYVNVTSLLVENGRPGVTSQLAGHSGTEKSKSDAIYTSPFNHVAHSYQPILLKKGNTNIVLEQLKMYQDLFCWGFIFVIAFINIEF